MVFAFFVAAFFLIVKLFVDVDKPKLIFRQQKPKVKDTSVDILFDADRIPYVYANSWEQAMYAQGYLHGKHRYATLELYRLISRGSLSLLIGEAGYDLDLFTTSLNFCRPLADRDDTITAYSRGVNYGLSEVTSFDDFGPFDHKMIPTWSTTDTLCVMRLIMTQMNTGVLSDILRHLIDKAFANDPEKAEELYLKQQAIIPPINSYNKKALFKDGVPVQPKKEDSPISSKYLSFKSDNEMRLLYAQKQDGYTIIIDNDEKKIKDVKKSALNFLHNMPHGSNSWAVNGALTESGSPILAVDPHLPMRRPNFWFPVMLISKNDKAPFRVTGLSVPGMPGIYEGHNTDVAWGITLGYADLNDLFTVKIQKEGDEFYYTSKDGEKLTVDSQIVAIYVKDFEDKVIKTKLTPIRSTHHGPIIDLTPFVHIDEKKPVSISLAATSLIAPVTGDFQKDIVFAKTWEDVYEAVLHLKSVGFNLAWANTEKDIGIFMSGSYPDRISPVDMIRDGSDADMEWKSLKAVGSLPHLMNPKDASYVFAANQRFIDDEALAYGTSFSTSYRSARIHDMLQAFQDDITKKSGKKLNVDDMTAMQLDVMNYGGKYWMENFVKVVQQRLGNIPDDAFCNTTTYKLMTGWNYMSNEESNPASLFYFWTFFTLRSLYRKTDHTLYRIFNFDRTTIPIIDTDGGIANNWKFVLENRAKTAPVDQLKVYQAAICQGLKTAQNYLLAVTKKTDVNELALGAINARYFVSPFTQFAPPDTFEKIGPYTTGGDRDTIMCLWKDFPFYAIDNLQIIDLTAPEYSGPGGRLVMDVGDWKKSVWTAPYGAKLDGDDIMNDYAAGKYKPMLWDDADIASAQVEKITIPTPYE